jgi:hypothetical protein
VAWQLTCEVLDHAPQDLTSGELVVLCALAEYARVDGRTWSGEVAQLARRARMRPGSIRVVLRRLAERGLDVRVPLGTDRHGHPLYAVPGKSPTFRLPELPAPPDCPCERCQGGTTVPPCPVDNSAKGVPQSPLTEPEGGTTVPAGGTAVPPYPLQGGTAVPPSTYLGRSVTWGGARAPARDAPTPSAPTPLPGPQPCGRRHDPQRPCRGCAQARRDAEQASAIAEGARVRAVRAQVRACRMCDADGALLEVGRFLPVSPPRPCDHETEHAAQVALARAEDP